MTSQLRKSLFVSLLSCCLLAGTVRAGDDTGLNFDGVNDKVTFTGLALSGTTGTIEFWLNPSSNIFSCLFVYNGTFGANGIGLGTSQGLLNVYMGGFALNTGYAVPLNVMNHYALSFSPSSLVVTVNGAVVYTMESPNIIAPTGSLSFSQQVFGGTLDEVRIWNTARTAADIAAKYNCAMGNLNTFPSALVHYYDFSSGTAGAFNNGTVIDRRNESLNGTLSGFAQNGTTSNYAVGKVFTGNTVVYVNAAATGDNDGSSWANAFTSLGDALVYANNLYCGIPQVWIAAGTYYPSRDIFANANPFDPRDKTFPLTANLQLYGGFAGTESSPVERIAGNVTVLSGDIGLAGDSTDNSYHVVTANGIYDKQYLDGLVITRGNANGVATVNSIYQSNGGGMVTRANSELTLVNVVFENNTAASSGGGLYLTGRKPSFTENLPGTALLLNTVFFNNHSAADGGGMSLIGSETEMVNCTAVFNSASSGAFVYEPSNFAPTLRLNIRNSIINQNQGASVLSGDFNFNFTTFSNAIIQDAAITGATVSHSDPHFRNVNLPKGSDGKWMTPDDGLATFGCDVIDKGNNAYIPANYTRDIALQQRITDIAYAAGGSPASPLVDLGAYESQLQVDTSQYSSVAMGSSHAIPFPHQRVPDSIGPVRALPVVPGNVVVYNWQKSSDELTWADADSIRNNQFYTIPESVNATRLYRCVTNLCGNSFTSNTVTITVINPPAGRILGRVTTVNFQAVQGVTIYAQKTIDLPGSPISHIDSTVTASNGNFVLDGLFYGDPNSFPRPSTVFKLWAVKRGHKFGPDTLFTTSISNNSDNPGYDFKDSTALGITGQVYQVCDICNDPVTGNPVFNVKAPLDSVSIYRSGLNNSTLSYVTKTGYLYGEYGMYTTTVDDPGNYLIKPQFNSHVFVLPSRSVTVSEPRDSIDFKDTTTHSITGHLRACNKYIGSAVLEFRDVLPNDENGNARPSAFYKRVTTDNQGFYSIRMPARKYTVKVIQFNELPQNNTFFVSSAAILSFFNDILNRDSLTRDITNRDTTLELDYHRPPTIETTGLEDSCTTGTPFTVMKQMVNKLFTVKVYEGTAAQGCPVRTIAGTASDSLRLLTNIQTNDDIQDLKFKLDSTGASKIILKPGIPNIVGPDYLKTMQIFYPDPYHRLNADASFTKNVVVTGIKSDPGTFTTVSPQVPLMVLHDPPGDGSFSTWSTNTSNQTALRMFANKGNSLNTWAEVKIGVEFNAGIGYEVPTSIWASLNGSLDVSSTINTDVESIVTTSTTQQISTSASPDITGASGDVFVGVAINLLYSGATEIKYNGGCSISSTRTFIVAPDSFSTQFVYTEDFIKNVVIPVQRQLSQNPVNTEAETNRYLNQLNVWEQVLANNEANKRQAVYEKNISFNGGASITSTTESSCSNANTIEFSLEMDQFVAGEAGLEIGGSGVSGGVTVGFKMETGNSRTNTQTNTVTTSYTLADDDARDYFSVDIKKDPVYNTPVFDLRAGTSSCPVEEGTQPRDEISLTVANAIQGGLAPGATAVYTFSIGNTSPSQEARTYKFGFNLASNPGAAEVRINGSTATEVTFPDIPWGEAATVTVEVKRGSTNVYSFEGLEFYAMDNCGGSVYKTAKISAFFVSPCSNIVLAAPTNNWVQTTNSFPLTVSGYDTSALTKIDIEYSKAGTDNWVTAFTLLKNQLVANPNSTVINWDIASLKDSTYNLRVKLYCNGGVVYSERSTGIVDRKAPSVFGKPEPADDNYVSGDLIGISYDEIISNTGLTSKVSMRNITDSIDIPVQASGYDNKIAIVPLSGISGLTGKTMRVVVRDISDRYGNVKSTPDTFQFTVGTAAAGTGPLLNVFISNASVQENGTTPILVKFKLSQPAADTMRINYAASGTAIHPDDYTVSYLTSRQASYTQHTGVGGSLMIPKNLDSAVLILTPVNDGYFEPSETIVITLADGGSYRIGSNSSVTGSIINDDPPAIYTFTGSGNFTSAANWQNNAVPPAELQSGEQIVINPSSGSCVLNIPLTILPGGSLTVAPGKNFIVRGNLTIRQ